MRLLGFVLAIAILVGGACVVMAIGGEKQPGRKRAQPVPIVQSWSGKLSDAALRKHQPASEFILDQETWARLWKAWRGEEQVPSVDFQTHMVLVFTSEGPNSVGCTPTHDGKGNIQARAMSTLIGGPGFGYLMLCISREGVGTVNGTALNGKAPPTKPPQAQPGAPPEPPASAAPGGSPGQTVESQPGPAAQIPPIKELDKLSPKRNALEASSVRKPLLLRSAKDAAEYFAEGELAKLNQQVDFAQQFVLLFGWRGSGQDRLESVVAESYPEQVSFTYKPGRTRDLREHVRVYALRSNVKWSVK